RRRQTNLKHAEIRYRSVSAITRGKHKPARRRPEDGERGLAQRPCKILLGLVAGRRKRPDAVAKLLPSHPGGLGAAGAREQGKSHERAVGPCSSLPDGP